MGPAYAVLGFLLVLFVALGFLVWRLTRQPGDESPRRRALKQARGDLRVAELTLHLIVEKIDLYRPTLDEVGTALAHEITSHIRDYQKKSLEEDK